jgi:hypothetical protein
MLSITLFHAAILRSVFRVFLPVVHRGIRDDAGRSYRMTYMLGESDFAAPHFPGTSIIPREPNALAKMKTATYPWISAPDIANSFVLASRQNTIGKQWTSRLTDAAA